MSIKLIYNFCTTDDTTDLESDILTSVRKAYFVDFARQKSRITADSEESAVYYEYFMEKDRPLRWTVKTESGQLLEKSEVASERYAVLVYSDIALYKKLIFSLRHTLLKVEYFDLANGEPTATLEPRRARDGVCLLYSSKQLEKPLALYPIDPIEDDALREAVWEHFDDCYALASTDEGVVMFLSDEQKQRYDAVLERESARLEAENAPELLPEKDAPLSQQLNSKDFNIKRNLASSIDITNAKSFLSFDDEDEQPEPQPHDEAAAVESEASPALDADEIASLAAQSINRATKDAADKIITAPDGVYRYYGEVNGFGERQGFGRTVTESGKTAYEGFYQDDRRSGVGAYYYKDGSLCYYGDWQQNERSGFGVAISSSSKDIHVGTWEADRPKGDGARVSPDGKVKFVCRSLSDGKTVLINFGENDRVVLSYYDEDGKKLSEVEKNLCDFFLS